MPFSFSLSAKERPERGRKNAALRREGFVPAILYGAGLEPRPLRVPASKIQEALRARAEEPFLNLQIESESPMPVFIQALQRDPLSGAPQHVDFWRVDERRPMEVNVAVRCVGAAPVVREQGAILVKALKTLRVRCLSKHLVSHIDADVSGLKDVTDTIRVKDLRLPEGIACLTPEHAAVTIVKAPRSEAELSALESSVEIDVTKVEVEKKGKKEEEAGEGAAPTDEKPKNEKSKA